MRSLHRFGFDAFEQATLALEAKGYRVLSPHRMDLELGFDPDKSLAENNFDLKDCVLRDVKAILKVDALVLLNGWETSLGAKAEKAVAEWLGLEVLLYANI